MRLSFSLAAVAALTTSVAYSQGIADLVAQIPTCAVTCLATAAADAGCGIADYSCQCGSAAKDIAKSAESCLAKSCDVKGVHLVVELNSNICNVMSCQSSSSSHKGGSAIATATASVRASSIPATTASVPASAIASRIATVPASVSDTLPAVTATAAAATVPASAGSRLSTSALVVGAALLVAIAL